MGERNRIAWLKNSDYAQVESHDPICVQIIINETMKIDWKEQ